MKKFAILIFIFVFCLLPCGAQAPRALNAAEIQLALKKLGTLCSVMHIAAHPDDENTALLAYLANERLCRTSYLSLTRGEGGQNLIGAEKGAALGVIRTQELLAARRIDGAEQLFTRAIDFGFSKTAEESLRLWNKQEVLADVVWAIRKFRPDVIITRFPPDARAGHGHHAASAILAEEAFKLAGDEKAFPEQLKYVAAWQPKRLVWNAFLRQGDQPAPDWTSVDVGAFNPLLGKSYTEIAGQSRSLHKSQGFGSAERRGSRVEYFAHVAGDKAVKDLFDGIETNWTRVEGGAEIQKLIETAQIKFTSQNPAAIVTDLTPARQAIRKWVDKISRAELLAGGRGAAAKQAVFEKIDYFNIKEDEIHSLVQGITGLWVESAASVPVAASGEQIEVTLTAVNRSTAPIKLLDAGSEFGSTSAGVNAELKFNQPFSTKFPYKISIKPTETQPFWLQQPSGNYLNNYDIHLTGGHFDDKTLFYTQVRAAIADDVYQFHADTFFRFVDRVNGEIYRRLVVAPNLTANLSENLFVFPDDKPKTVRVNLRAFAPQVKGKVFLKLPADWRAAPAEFAVDLKKGEETTLEFQVSSFKPQAPDGKLEIEFQPETATTRESLKSIQTIDYQHIPQQTLFPAAEAKLVKLDIKTGRERIGYIMGSGDEIPDALRQLGYDVKLLSDEDLQNLDSAANFDTIVAGIRAYNTRQILRKTNKRLLDFVAAGGKIIVQYNTNDNTLFADFAPFALKIGRDRVTVEDAPVKFLAPDARVLNFPNRITDKDFAGWVQERGIYFASEFDAAKFTPVLGMNDPNEKESNGALVVARHGKGEFVYTGLVFFRQLPAGNAGAYRLFVNLISNENRK